MRTCSPSLTAWIDTLRVETKAACDCAEPTQVLAARLPKLVNEASAPIAELAAMLDGQSSAYSRWQLFQDACETFQVLLLHWPAGAHTPVHDHGGLWGVECTLQGQLNCEDFQIERSAAGLQLRTLGTTRKLIGEVQVIRPDLDHAHRCWNASTDCTALTLHIYGGTLRNCAHFQRDELTWNRAPAKPCETRDFWACP